MKKSYLVFLFISLVGIVSLYFGEFLYGILCIILVGVVLLVYSLFQKIKPILK
jgi:hypothetical protein